MMNDIVRNDIVSVVCINVVLCRQLYKKDLFPANTKIVGYARSALSIAQLKERVKPFLKVHASGLYICITHSYNGYYSLEQMRRRNVMISLASMSTSGGHMMRRKHLIILLLKYGS